MIMEKGKYIARMVKDLKVWSKTIEAYKVRASRGPTALQADYDQRIRNLQEKRDLLSSKLRELQESAGDSWMTLEAGVETAKHDLRDAFESARQIVKKAA